MQDIGEVIAQLPTLHSTLWAVFNECPNRDDNEQMERFLEPEDIRHHFYEALGAYAKGLTVALGAVAFYETVSDRQIGRYKRDLVMFHNLRSAVRNRYAETIDYSDYEARVRKLMSEHIQANAVVELVPELDIFDQAQFAVELARLAGRPVAQADTIASHARRAITEKAPEDPAFYRKLSQLIDEAFQLYKQGRIDEIEYLKRMRQAEETLASGVTDNTPARLSHSRDARAYFGIISESLESRAVDLEILADMAIEFEKCIESLKVRDWVGNRDVENKMKRDLDDQLYTMNRANGWNLSDADQDVLLNGIIAVARQRDSLA